MVAHLLLVATLLALAGPTAAGAQPDPGEWSSDPVEWEGTIAAGTPVRIVNRHGDLRLRGVPGDLARFLGYAQHHGDDRRPIEIAPRLDDGVWTLEVRMPPTDGDGRAPETWSRRRVDLTVYVPKASPLFVETDAGTLEAIGQQASIEAVSRSGDVTVSGATDVRASTASGHLKAMLPDPGWSAAMALETSTGPITLVLRRDASLVATAETRGRLVTDFSVDVEPGELGARLAELRFGEGAGRVEIATYQGDVSFEEIELARVRDAR